MKQRRIKELTINHYEQGSSVAYTPSRTEEYAPVLAQAEAHQDLRFHTQINSVETLIILPWESVISVFATYETADVTAPTDTICGGAADGGLELVLQDAEVIDASQLIYYNRPSEGCRIEYPSFDTIVKQVLLDGVDITYEMDGAVYTANTNGGETATSDENTAFPPVNHACDDTTFVNGVRRDVTVSVTYNGLSASATASVYTNVAT